MRKVREILRLRFERGLSHRQISASTGVSKGALSEYLRRASVAGLTWEVARTLDDGEVEARLFRYPGRNEPPRRVPIDLPWVHRELRRTGVTLQQLWLEYREAAAQSLPSGGTPYGYSQFCDLYADFREKTDLSMRQVHRAGEKVFIDYSGKKPQIWSPETGEAIDVELFVAVLGASNYTFAEATRTQRLEDFCASTVRALEFFGGVPRIAVPDQLRSAVSGPDRYDPEINPTYAELSQHYDVAIVPARPGKPRDKAKVETAVLVAQRWILFFASLGCGTTNSGVSPDGGDGATGQEGGADDGASPCKGPPPSCVLGEAFGRTWGIWRRRGSCWSRHSRLRSVDRLCIDRELVVGAWEPEALLLRLHATTPRTSRSRRNVHSTDDPIRCSRRSVLGSYCRRSDPGGSSRECPPRPRERLRVGVRPFCRSHST